MLSDGMIDKLQRITRGMEHNKVDQYPQLMQLLKDNKLIFPGEEDQPVGRFIPEVRKLLGMYAEEL